MAWDGPKWGREFFFRLIQTLPTFWAERILILRIFTFWTFWIPNFQISRSQISKFPEIWPGPSLGPGLGPPLGAGGRAGGRYCPLEVRRGLPGPQPGLAQARPKLGPGQISGNLEIWDLEIWKVWIQQKSKK